MYGYLDNGENNQSKMNPSQAVLTGADPEKPNLNNTFIFNVQRLAKESQNSKSGFLA